MEYKLSPLLVITSDMQLPVVKAHGIAFTQTPKHLKLISVTVNQTCVRDLNLLSRLEILVHTITLFGVSCLKNVILL